MPRYRYGSGSVYRRGKTYWISYYESGRRIRESAETKDKTEIRKTLQTKMGQIAEGKFVRPAAVVSVFKILSI